MDSTTYMSFRLTTVEDHAALVAIDVNLYDGMDHIMEQYSTTIIKPHYYGALAEINGRVVAYVAANVHLEGTKLCMKGARVSPDLRGSGYYRKLLDYLRNQMKEKYPGLIVEEFFTNDANPSLDKLLSSSIYKEFFRRPFRNFRLRKLQSLEGSGLGDCSIGDVGVEGIRNIIRDDIKCKRMFPTRVFIGWEMYDPLLSEIADMAAEHPLVLETRRPIGDSDVKIMTTQVSHKTRSGEIYLIQTHIDSNKADLVTARVLAVHLHGHMSRITKFSEDDIFTISIDVACLEVLQTAVSLLELEGMEQYSKNMIGFYRNI